MSHENDIPESVKVLISYGRKIEAIKTLRTEQGLGLKEAKEAVEAYIETNPEIKDISGKVESSGLGKYVFIAIIVVAALVVFRDYI